MLFLVISTPRAEAPSEATSRRKLFWKWIEPLLASGEMKAMYPRVGRGGVVIFDVPSNEVLHQRMSEWAEMVYATFEVYPLVDGANALAYLDQHRKPEDIVKAKPTKPTKTRKQS